MHQRDMAALQLRQSGPPLVPIGASRNYLKQAAASLPPGMLMIADEPNEPTLPAGVAPRQGVLPLPETSRGPAATAAPEAPTDGATSAPPYAPACRMGLSKADQPSRPGGSAAAAAGSEVSKPIELLGPAYSSRLAGLPPPPPSKPQQPVQPQQRRQEEAEAEPLQRPQLLPPAGSRSEPLAAAMEAAQTYANEGKDTAKPKSRRARAFQSRPPPNRLRPHHRLRSPHPPTLRTGAGVRYEREHYQPNFSLVSGAGLSASLTGAEYRRGLAAEALKGGTQQSCTGLAWPAAPPIPLASGRSNSFGAAGVGSSGLMSSPGIALSPGLQPTGGPAAPPGMPSAAVVQARGAALAGAVARAGSDPMQLDQGRSLQPWHL